MIQDPTVRTLFFNLDFNDIEQLQKFWQRNQLCQVKLYYFLLEKQKWTILVPAKINL